jgi:C-terminal processing protease CtpA/Prc
MTLWKTGALAGALFVAAGAGAAFMPAAQGKGPEPQRWDRDGDVLQSIVQITGRSGRIGVNVRDVDDSDSTKSGVVVDDVREGSPAEKAGIKNGDQIVELDGERVRSVRQFTRLVQDTPVGRKVPVVVVRGGQRVTLTVAPERVAGWRSDDDFAFMTPPEPPEPPEPPDPADAPRAPHAPKPPAPPRPALPFGDLMPEFGFSYFGSGGRLGLTLEDLSAGLSEYFGVKHGALVRSVSEGSVAAKAGIKAGDVITAVNGTTVDEPGDVRRAIDHLEDQADVTIEVVRDKKPQTMKGKLEPRERVRSRTVV